MSIFHKLHGLIQDACYIWYEEMKQVFRDEGVLIFFIIVPLAYPLLYSWIYNNEVVREVPVVVVDQSHSHLSRQFIRECDASPDVKVAYYAEDLDEAKTLVSRQVVKGGKGRRESGYIRYEWWACFTGRYCERNALCRTFQTG